MRNCEILFWLTIATLMVPNVILDITEGMSQWACVANILLPLGSLVYLLFCVTKYGWGWENFKREANTGKGVKMQEWMRVYLVYILPLIVLFIFGFGIYDKFFA